MKPRLVMLHGFTGSGAVFDHVRDGLLAVADVETPDMPFHQTGRCVNAELILDLEGLTPGPSLLQSYDSSAEHEGPTPGPSLLPFASLRSTRRGDLVLHGYSMGGRIAMREALANPDRVGMLILESTHPGIESEVEREERRQRDATLAASIRQNYPGFLAAWNRLPLFASPPDAPSAPRDRFLAIQRSQDPEQMARSLAEHGAGTMLPVRDRLHTLPMPVLAITGALDIAYTDLWADIVRETPNIRHAIVPNAGHRVHLDNPESYLQIITSFINEHFPS